jgi:flagellar biosynthesis protein FlhF
MQIRTFLARDMREALTNVRAEMGPDAIIVASQRAKGGGIMVRAAFDNPGTDREIAPPPVLPNADQIESRSVASFESHFREGLARRLRGESSGATDNGRSFERAALLSILHHSRAPDSLAHALAQAAEQSGLSDMTLALASALDKRMRAVPLQIGECKALLLAGPPGAGKTATAAKIAAHARLAGRTVRLIAADAAGAGAVARLESFANHLGVAIVVADSAENLSSLIVDAAGENTLTIIDTAGFDPRNAKARTAFTALARIEHVEALGILSACNDAEEISDTVRALLTLGARRLVITCLDLSRRAGALLAAATQGADLAHVTRSPFVAGGLETLTPLSLSRLLIESEIGRADRGSAQ